VVRIQLLTTICRGGKSSVGTCALNALTILFLMRFVSVWLSLVLETLSAGLPIVAWFHLQERCRVADECFWQGNRLGSTELGEGVTPLDGCGVGKDLLLWLI
jgi:hypothetical protein